MSYDNYVEFHHQSASCEVFLDNGVGLVHRVYSKDRGRGQGSALLRRVTEWADENGLELFLRAQAYGHPVQTILDNNQLIKFYEKFGFEREDSDDICMSNIPMRRLPLA